jgi:hypothetical protein
MNKLGILVLLLVLAFSSNAQNTVDTMGSVCIPYPVIKSIQTDLLIGDSAKELLSIVSTESLILKEKIDEQNSVIDRYKIAQNNLNLQINNLKDQVNIHVNMYDLSENKFNRLSKEFRKTKIRNKFWNIVLITGTAVLAGEMLYYRSLYIKNR